jgi:small subunit ribosomal protein S14
MKRTTLAKIKVGKTKLERFKKHNLPKKRKFGQSLTICKRCGGKRRHISKYGLNICGRCFREVAQELGFKKLR